MAVSGKKLLRSHSGIRVVPINNCLPSPFELPEPKWIPDPESLCCMHCDRKFDFFRRRHHCRRCGKLFCGLCSETRIPLPRMCFLDPVRLCPPCAETTCIENEFFDQDIKALYTGGILNVSSVLYDGSENSLAECCLSQDQQQILISGTSSLTVAFETIVNSQISKEPGDNGKLTGINIHFTQPDGSVGNVILESPPDAPSTAFIFLTGLQKALELDQENKTKTET